MPNRALSIARTLTGTAVAAAGLATAALGVHLATDHQSAQAAQAPRSSTGSADQQPQQSAPQQQDDGGGFFGGFSGFGQVQAPSTGGGGQVHARSNGS